MDALHGVPALIPLQQRPLLGSNQYDPTRECWTLTRDDGLGKIHVAYAPWLSLTLCHHHLVIEPHRLIAEWMAFPVWGQDHVNLHRFCATCRKAVPSLPWEMLLPDCFDPPTCRDEAAVIADWWEERGEQVRSEAIRYWIEKGQS